MNACLAIPLSAIDSYQRIDLHVLHAAIPLCIGVAIYDLSNAHEHEHEGPQYPYMHIRTKDYPWGACTLFDQHCWNEQKKGHEEEE